MKTWTPSNSVSRCGAVFGEELTFEELASFLYKEKRKNQAPILKNTPELITAIQDWRAAALKRELSGAEFKQRRDGV